MAILLNLVKVDFVENFTTKINCLGESVYWAYNQVTICTACVWKHGGTHSIVIVSDYPQYMASMLRMSSSKTILQHLDSTVHQFQEVVTRIFRWCCKSI